MANSAETRAADGPPPRPRETIGALLRRAREEQGADLDRIAAQLRIREAYLAAIEQARYDRLPGPVYALGFVRTYANHLGLDGDEAVRRFKLDAAGMEQRRDLAFPMPLTPRSVPGGRVLLVALILAICAYGIWHYVSIDRNRPERVAAVPTDLLPPPPPAPAAASPSPTAAAGPAPQTPSSNTEATPAPSDETAAASAPPVAAPVTSVTSVPLPPAGPAAGSLVAPPPPLANTTMAQNTPAQQQSSSVQAAAPMTSPSPPQTAASASLPAALTAQVASPPPGAPDATAIRPAAAPPAAPHVFGAVNGPSRITLKAVQDCWILVRDSGDGDAVVAQRTLHAGDTYRVPDRPGLVLRTGNASGLEVDVDDKTAPKLGGTVRNVALDATRLLAGNATVE